MPHVVRPNFPTFYSRGSIHRSHHDGKEFLDMANLNPVPCNHAMWRAYAVAPAVTPIAFVALLAPLGIVLPLIAFLGAVVICYFVAGLLGMPIAFLLRRGNALNALTIHGAALLWGVVWSTFCTVVAIYAVVAIGGSVHSLPLTAAYSFAVMVPPVVLSGTAFWLLLKNPKWI